MKIIFLDIDGVLNGYNSFSLLCWKISKLLRIEKFYKKHRIDPFGIHITKVKRLAKIVNETGARVVMTSSWRFRYQRYCYDILNEINGGDKAADHDSDIVKLHKLFGKYNISVIGFTVSGPTRGQEINDWLESHDTPDSYIILDDENSDIVPYVDLSRFIQTSTVPIGCLITGKGCENTGLRRKHVKLAIQILNRKES